MFEFLSHPSFWGELYVMNAAIVNWFVEEEKRPIIGFGWACLGGTILAITSGVI